MLLDTETVTVAKALPATAHADRRPVLVVEDSDDDFDTVVAAAHSAHLGNRLVRATTAGAAWSLLARRPAGCFAFMLLDHNLPGADGLGLLADVRRHAVLAALPVVVFTSSINPHDREGFFAAGASAFHTKSVQHADCLHTLQAIFSRWLNPQPMLTGNTLSPSTGPFA